MYGSYKLKKQSVFWPTLYIVVERFCRTNISEETLVMFVCCVQLMRSLPIQQMLSMDNSNIQLMLNHLI